MKHEEPDDRDEELDDQDEEPGDQGDEPDDESLLRAWVAGDQEAARVLVERYTPVLRKYFGNKVATVEDADDLMQQTFLACTESASEFRGNSSFRTFLLTLAHNKLVDYYKKKKRQPPFANLEEISVAALCTGPSTLVARNERERLLIEALRRLPLDDQEVLEFRFWLDLKTSEIAEILARNENAIKSQIRRAKERLKEILRELGAEE
jgi:RNA polymerase sigma factor (sigma-70 family)